MWKTLPALLYLAFCVPLFWVDVVNRFTLPMQQLSTQMAMKMLTLGGMEPIQDGPTTILLNNYPLNVAAPCSGAKLTLALAAFTIFFILIDIELLFIWPWAMLYRRLGWFGFVEMLVFLSILMLGFFYIWRKGGFEWE